jgi:hypothetical protein
MGAFDHKGTVLRSYASLKEEFTNVGPLRARQEGERGSHANASQWRKLVQRRFRPDAASAARIRWARAFARLSAVNFPLVRSCSCWSLSN